MSKPIHWAIPEPPPQQPAISGLDYEGLQKCIHCGFCIEACPTYRQTGLETASPRGRLALMRAVAEGKLPIDEGFAEPMGLCLGCRACESACPSGVPYGHLLEEARDLAAKVVPLPWVIRFGLKHVLPFLGRLRLLAKLVRLMRPLLPGALRALVEAMPRASVREAYPEPADPRVAFFHGCVQEAFMPQQNRAAVRVLGAMGSPCTVPKGQVCCGALHAHAGDLDGARTLARQNIARFEQVAGPIINHAGGCGTHLKEYGHLLKDDPVWAERATAFATRVKDLSEWLVEVGVEEGILGRVEASVTYQDSCHLVHGQKVRRQPRALLRAIPGITYQEMFGADQCCGSAGIYNVLQPAMAEKILNEKMAYVQATEAQVIVTANPGCYLQLCQGVRRHGLSGKVEVLTLAELLERSLFQSE